MRGLFFLLYALVAAVPCLAAQYEVKIQPETRDLLLELAITPDATRPVKFSTRGVAWGLRAQVQDVRCGKVALDRDGSGSWIAPPGCRRISWTVRADPVSDGDGDPSRQRTLAVGREPWFLLAEPTSLLRRPGDSSASSIDDSSASDRFLGATPLAAGGFRVPPANNAPEFYVLGPAPTLERVIDRFHVTYVADEPDRVKRLGLDTLHAKALSYLSAIVALPKSVPDSSRRLLVVWLASRDSRGPVGGAAGSRSFVANYLIGSSANARTDRAMTVAIIAHEQFHQLVDMLRGPLPPLPVWLSESLAQYYGLKALLHAEDTESVHAVRARFIDRSMSVPEGLLALNRRYASGDRAVYGRFYSQGATLWNAVDSAIAAATAGKQSLDDYLNPLLISHLSGDGALPTAFVESLRRAAGPEIDRIVLKYVGS